MEIGELFKQIREQKGLSLRELSEKSGLSASFIGQVERNETSPSMRSVMSMAQALGIKLTELFSTIEEAEASPVITSTNRRKLDKVFPGVEMYILSPNNDGLLQPIFIIAQPGGSTGDGFFRHEGEEFAFVMSGSLWIQLGENEYSLQEGDSISFKSSLPHRWENRGNTNSICIWILTPPSW